MPWPNSASSTAGSIARGIEFEALDNGFAAGDQRRLQRTCDGLTASSIDGFVRKWLRMLPNPYTAADRRAGFDYRISILQAEFSLTQMLDAPRAGDGHRPVLTAAAAVLAAQLGALSMTTLGCCSPTAAVGRPVALLFAAETPRERAWKTGEQARVSTATARRAVVEYVETGQRPTCVSWEPEPQPAV